MRATFVSAVIIYTFAFEMKRKN